MLVAEGPEVDKLPALLPLSLWFSSSGPSPDSEAVIEDLSLSLSPPAAAGNELLVVAAATVNVGGTEIESPSRRTKFTYALTNPVELNFGRQIGSHDAEAELLYMEGAWTVFSKRWRSSTGGFQLRSPLKLVGMDYRKGGSNASLDEQG